MSTLLVRLRETFGSRVELRVLDPKCLFWIFSVMRYRIKATEPAWILRGRCVFRGIPSWEELHHLLEEEIAQEKKADRTSLSGRSF